MQTNDVLIGLDAGTSVIKAVAFSHTGRQLALTAEANELHYVEDGGVEQDIGRTWDSTVRVLRRLVEQLDGASVAALAITGQGDGTWLLDQHQQPLAPGWLWLDARSGSIVRGWRESGIGDQVCRITGTGLNLAQQSGQLQWLKQHRPDVLQRAAVAMHCKDWLYYNCCGELATDISEGVFTFGDYRTREYSNRVLELLDLSDCKHLLPPLLDGSSHYGRLLPEAAQATGLTTGTPVVLAPVDALCTALGGGVYEPEIKVGFSISGSTGIHMRLCRGVNEVRPHNAAYTMPLPASPALVGLMCNMAATLNIDWVVDMAADLLSDTGNSMVRQELLLRLDQLAGAAQPGQLIYHPFIIEAGERGPFVDPNARAQLLGLTQRIRFPDLLRGVYESLGFAARDCYEAMGHKPEELRVAGGGANSPTLRKIMASVLGVPLRVVDQSEAGAAGAAMVACLALGWYPDLDAVCRNWVRPRLRDPEAPDAELSALYERLLPIYRDGYQVMTGVWRSLAELNVHD